MIQTSGTAVSFTQAAVRNLLRVVKTRKTELLFLALFLRLLRPGGRAAVIVPEGVLFGSTKAHKELRRKLVEDHVPTATTNRGFFVRAEDAHGAAVYFEEAR